MLLRPIEHGELRYNISQDVEYGLGSNIQSSLMESNHFEATVVVSHVHDGETRLDALRNDPFYHLYMRMSACLHLLTLTWSSTLLTMYKFLEDLLIYQIRKQNIRKYNHE